MFVSASVSLSSVLGRYLDLCLACAFLFIEFSQKKKGEVALARLPIIVHRYPLHSEPAQPVRFATSYDERCDTRGGCKWPWGGLGLHQGPWLLRHLTATTLDKRGSLAGSRVCRIWWHLIPANKHRKTQGPNSPLRYTALRQLMSILQTAQPGPFVLNWFKRARWKLLSRIGFLAFNVETHIEASQSSLTARCGSSGNTHLRYRSRLTSMLDIFDANSLR